MKLKKNLLLEQVVDEFYPIFKSENKSIVIHSDSNINIYADPDKISRVFNNILKKGNIYGVFNNDSTISSINIPNR